MFRPHRATAVFSVAILSAITAAAVANDEPAPDIYAAAKAALAQGKYAKTEILGGGSARPFTDLYPRGGLLSGLECGVGPDGNIEIVWAIKPIFRTARGDMPPLPERGLFVDRTLFVEGKAKVVRTRVKRTVTLRAPAGYAVGGITVRAGLNLNGLALIYYPIVGDQLDPNRPRTSEWVGDRTGGSERTVTAKGQPVVGIFGSIDEIHVYGLGLVYMIGGSPAVVKPPPTLPRTEKAVEPPTTRPRETETPTTGTEKAVPTPSTAPGPFSAKPAEEASTTEAPSLMTFALFGGVALAVALPVFLLLRNSAARVELAPPRPRVAPNLAQGLPQNPAPHPTPPPVSDEPPLDVLPAARKPSEAISATPLAPPPAWRPTQDDTEAWNNPPIEKPDPMRAYRDMPASLREAPQAQTALAKARKEVSNILFALAALQFVCGLAMVGMADQLQAPGMPKVAQAPTAAFEVVAIAFVFAGLGFWGRVQPLPPAIIGTVIYVGLQVLMVVTNPATIMYGIPVKIFIVIALIRAISSASKANEFR